MRARGCGRATGRNCGGTGRLPVTQTGGPPVLLSGEFPDGIELCGVVAEEFFDDSGHEEEGGAVVGIVVEQTAEDGGGFAGLAGFE